MTGTAGTTGGGRVALGALGAACKAFYRGGASTWTLVLAVAAAIIAGDLAASGAVALRRPGAPVADLPGLVVTWAVTVPFLLATIYGSLPHLEDGRAPTVVRWWALGIRCYGIAWRALASAGLLAAGALVALAVVDVPAYAVRPLGLALLVPFTAVIGILAVLCVWLVQPVVFLGGSVGGGVAATLRVAWSSWPALLGLALACGAAGVPLTWLGLAAQRVPLVGAVGQALCASTFQVFASLAVWRYASAYVGGGH